MGSDSAPCGPLEWVTNDLALNQAAGEFRHFVGWGVVRLSTCVKSAVLAFAMNRLVSMVLSAILGLVVCFAMIVVANSMGLAPRFPAFAGEDDFGQRIGFFLLFTCPGFVIIGAWIGRVFTLDKRLGILMWGGVMAGSAVTFTLAHVLSPAINTLATSETSNFAVFTLFFFWVVFSALGGWLVGVYFRKPLRGARSRAALKE